MEVLSVLIVSCDKYADLWDAFLICFRKYWKDCPYKVFLGTNHKSYNQYGAESICIGEDISWADNVYKMLNRIETPYVLMMLEDFYMDKKVDSSKVRNLLCYMERENVDCLRLEPCPPPSRVSDRHLMIGKLNPKLPYYVSTQPAIWKKEVLLDMLKPGYSAWDFEILNSANAKKMNYNFWASQTYVTHHRNGVERGKYYLSTLIFLKRENILVDWKSRGVINDYTIRRRLHLLWYRLREYICVKSHPCD